MKLIDIDLFVVFFCCQEHFFYLYEVVDALSEELVGRLSLSHRFLEGKLLLLTFNDGLEANDLFALLLCLENFLFKLLDVLFATLTAICG